MKKFSLLLIALAMISLLVTPGCKSEDPFTIVGTWTGTLTWSDSEVNSCTWTFTGTESSGSVSINNNYYGSIISGTYTVTGTSVTLNTTWQVTDGAAHTANGMINEATNTISGNFTQDNGWTGTWTCSR